MWKNVLIILASVMIMGFTLGCNPPDNGGDQQPGQQQPGQQQPGQQSGGEQSSDQW